MSVDGVANVESIVGAVLAVPSLVQIFRTKRVADEVKDRVSSVEAKLAKLSAVMLSRQ
jgi:Tfp pilus assembly protein FimT